MKHIIFLIAITFCVGILSAQDVIVLHNGELIEDVTNITIGDNNISYSKDGNALTIPRTSAQAILYADGRYEEIKAHKPVSIEETHEQVVPKYQEDDSEAKRLAKEQKAREAEEKKLAQQQVQEQKRREAAERKHVQDSLKTAALEQARIEAEQAIIAKEQARLTQEQKYQDGQIHHLGTNHWYYLDKHYSTKEINSIILSCPDAKQQYDMGKKFVISGWSTVGVGIILLSIGAPLMSVGIQQENEIRYDAYGDRIWDNYGMGKTITGVIMIALAGAAGGVGIPLAAVGHSKMNNAYKVYNNSCTTKQDIPLSFNFGPTRDGIELTLNF